MMAFDEQMKVLTYLNREKVDVEEESDKYTKLLLSILLMLDRGRSMNYIRKQIRRRVTDDKFADKVYGFSKKQSKLLQKKYNLKKVPFSTGLIKKLEVLEGQTFAQAMRARRLGIMKSAVKFAREAKDLKTQKISSDRLLFDYIKRKKQYDESGFDTIAHKIRNYTLEKIDSKLKVKGWISIAVFDRRTSPICMSLHNRFYSKQDFSNRSAIPDQPPRHLSCRSELITIEEEEDVNTYKQQTLDTFFNKNPKIAKDLLGQEKYRIWKKSGVKASRLYNPRRGKFYTNEELEKRILE